MDGEGAITFWLTKESGRVPYCDADGCDSVSHAGSAAEVRRAYIVVLVAERTSSGDDVYVVFAPFSYESLVLVVTSVLYSVSVQLQLALQGMRVAGVADSMSALHGGMFSSEQPCLCSVGFGKCIPCESVVTGRHRFVSQAAFAGLHPLGHSHWWRGVSDAAGDIDGIAWLRCLCTASRELI